MSYDTIVVDGQERSTGLLIPEQNVSALASYASSGPMWDKEEVLEALRGRTPARQIFGDDWIKDQNGVGACAGYAAASALERARRKRGLKHVKLSGDGIYAAVNGGRDQGSTLESNMQWLTKYGIPPESEVPRHEYRKNRIPAKAYQEGERFKGFEAYFLDTELEAACALAADFILVIAVHAGNGGRSPDGMIDWQNGPGNHSVVVDDVFYNNQFEFEFANSWGLRWGDRGRAKVTWRQHLSTPIKYHKFYAIRSTMDDPQDDNPEIN